jgi:deoxyadenosine/deoxycytidine kinase
MIKRDRNQTKKWQESYYQHLFTEFKTFIDKYNEGLQVKGDKLSTRVNDLKITKRNLQNEIDKLELKKKVLANV